MKDLNDERKDMTPLFETIVNYIPAPTGDPDATHRFSSVQSTTTSMLDVSVSVKWITVKSRSIRRLSL